MTEELKELESRMSDGKTFNVEDAKKFSRLSSFTTVYQEYLGEKSNYEGLVSMANDPEDVDLQAEAKLELEESIPKMDKLASGVTSKLLPPHEFSDRGCILELRPGAGGQEAMIFTQDLLTMYYKYAQVHRWKCEILSQNESTSGGLVDGSLLIDHPGAYDRLRHEAGVHRVQRVPQTEVKGRVHTSTAAVVVLPKIEEGADEGERKFAGDELRIDVMRASGSGGQHVNTTESAVRITHIPTGIVVINQDERSQHKNKAKALMVLRARLAEKERLEKVQKERAERRDQVSSTDRSDKIRTYNFSQNRVTDHRCGLSLHDLSGCMNGESLDQVIDAVEAKETELQSLRLIEDLEHVNK
ncbi:unnamed protein product [Kuraishia capsulata CBS 1993]|uniref:Peptide chain release factor 1, mitochondrial n=1 Tax=Kuraishia capsulata CBS 1993 TaxID=1382522 RepID=W6MI35_9ASCO|nr:uncharacterized protein KUCA_T00002025001 [Kuraishia capsulata CBS 1993]CDK26054.1 unnamed protein product [Kuraishia capsulata CBS 1993]